MNLFGNVPHRRSLECHKMLLMQQHTHSKQRVVLVPTLSSRGPTACQNVPLVTPKLPFWSLLVFIAIYTIIFHWIYSFPVFALCVIISLFYFDFQESYYYGSIKLYDLHVFPFDQSFLYHLAWCVTYIIIVFNCRHDSTTNGVDIMWIP